MKSQPANGADPQQSDRPLPLRERMADFLLNHPKLMIAILVAMAGFGASQIPYIQVDVGLGPFLRDDDPLRHVLADVNDRFVNDENLFVVYQNDDVFSKESLEDIRALGDELLDLSVAGTDDEAILEVTSLATTRVVEGGDLEFRNPDLVPDPVPSDPAALAKIRQRAYANDLINSSLVADDGTVAVLIARVPHGLSYDEVRGLVDDVRGLVAERSGNGTEYLLTGKPAVRADEGAFILADLKLFVPASMGVCLLLLFLFVRRGLSVAVGVTETGIIILFSTGVLVSLGGTLNSTSAMLPPLVAALAAALSIHYLCEIGKHARANPGESPMATARRTLSQLFVPTLIAAVTTSVGFAANAVSDIPAIRHFGLAVGAAVLASTVTTVFFFALVVRKRHADDVNSPKALSMSGGLQRLLRRLAHLHLRHYRVVVVASVAVIAVAVAGISRVEIGMDKLGAFGPETEIKQATTLMENEIGGTAQLIMSIRHRDQDHFMEPENLAKLEALREFLHSPAVGADTVLSVTDHLKMMHRGFFNDDPKEARLPDSIQMVAQLLMINGDPTLRQYIDSQRRWVRVMARAPAADSLITEARFRAVDAYLAEHFPAEEGYEPRELDNGLAVAGATSTGTGKLFSYTVNELAGTVLKGFGLAFLVIFTLLFLLFRSISTGLFSIPVNIMPVIANLGLMGWLGIRLDAATVMISSVCIGVAVDDSVHFLQYLRERLASHKDLGRGVTETLTFKGPAIIGTSIVLTTGCMVVLLSNFETTRHFGLLLGTGVVAALVGDLVLLPSLLLWCRARLGIRTEENSTSSATPVSAEHGALVPPATSNLTA